MQRWDLTHGARHLQVETTSTAHSPSDDVQGGEFGQQVREPEALAHSAGHALLAAQRLIVCAAGCDTPAPGTKLPPSSLTCAAPVVCAG